MAAAQRVMERGISDVAAFGAFSTCSKTPALPCPLVDDTVYRRTRRAVTEAFHAVDDLIHEWRRSRHQILFEAASPMSLAVFEPVLARLQTDDRLDFWFTTSDAAWGAADIFGGSAVAARAADEVRRVHQYRLLEYHLAPPADAPRPFLSRRRRQVWPRRSHAHCAGDRQLRSPDVREQRPPAALLDGRSGRSPKPEGGAD